MMAQASVFAGLLVLISLASIAESQNGIALSPPNSQTVAANSPENITYTCTVSEGRGVQWAFSRIQLTQGSSTLVTLLANGLVIQPGANSSQSTIIYTSAVRSFLIASNIPIIEVSCDALSQSDVGIDFGDSVFIRTFNSPTEVLNLQLNPQDGDLTRLELSWEQPENTVVEPADPVITTYTINVTGPTFNFVNTTTDLSYIIIDDPDMECAEHQFNVFASNDAGTGPVRYISETIPISPDITGLEASLVVTDIQLSSAISANVVFDAATACSVNFPIMRYEVTVSIGDQSVVELFFVNDTRISGQSSITLPVPTALLQLDMEYQVVVSACISVTCRHSLPRTLRTTDTQTASITFFQTNVFLQCTFASSIAGVGCGFRLTLANGEMEMLSLPQQGGNPCETTNNMENAYTSIEVVDLEANGMFGSVTAPLDVTPPSDSPEQYMIDTGCTPTGPLSPGAIAGIVIGVLAAVLIILAIAIVIAVVCYRQRTKSLPKMRSTEDEKVYVDFEKHWLMDESMIKRSNSKKSRVGFKRGGSAVDGTDEINLAPADALATEGKAAHGPSPPPAQGSATMPILGSPQGTSLTNPPAAFTLHIDKDRKRARLHLDKALIRRVLREQRMQSTIDRKSRTRTAANLQARELLLPLHSEIHLTGDDEEEQDPSAGPVTNL